MKRRTVLCAAALVLTPLMVTGTSSSAASKPTLRLTIPVSKVNAGHTIFVAYSASGLPKGSTLYLERQFGVKKVWKPVLKLGGNIGTASVPGVPLGIYSYALWAIHQPAVWKSPTVGLISYGRVSLALICAEENRLDDTGDCLSPGTIQIASNLFTYVTQQNWGVGASPPYWSDPFSLPANTCRQLIVNFGLPNTDATDDTSNIEVIQTTLSPEESSTPYGQLGTIIAKLDGGPWNLQANTSDGSTVFENGYAMCFTASGLK
jgi:hypothetical protein